MDNAVDESSWNYSSNNGEIEDCLMVTFSMINKIVIVDNTDIEIEYNKIIHLHLASTSTIRLTEDDEDREPLLNNDLLDSSTLEIGGDECDHLQTVEKEEDGMKEPPGMAEGHYDSKPWIMLTINNQPPRNSPSCYVVQEDQVFKIWYLDEIDQVDTECANVAVTELVGANDPNVQRQKEDLADYAIVD